MPKNKSKNKSKSKAEPTIDLYASVSGISDKKLAKLARDKSQPKAYRKNAEAELLRRASHPTVDDPDDGDSPRETEPTIDDVFQLPADATEQERMVKGAHADDALPDETEVAYQYRKAAERDEASPNPQHSPQQIIEAAERVLADPNASEGAIKSAKAARKRARAALSELPADVLDAQLKDTLATKRKARKAESDSVAEVVETEHGREFQVGPEGKASRAEVVAVIELDGEGAIERDHLGRPKIPQLDDAGAVIMVSATDEHGHVVKDPETGKTLKVPKTKAYSRMTTYIDCLDDRSMLEGWKLRTALIGIAASTKDSNYAGTEGADLIDSTLLVTDAYEKAIKAIAKRERKGELNLGQFGLLKAEALSAHKRALDVLAEAALELGGANENRTKGTNLHALTQMLDEGQINLEDEGQIQGMIDNGLAIQADIDDLKAYRAKMIELGIEHFAIEQFVVLDDLAVAGTFDRASMVKLPGSSRRVRLVGDLKTGRVDYSAGKIGLQMYGYAIGKTFDPAKPAERGDLKLSKSKALLIHLPQGEARCEVYVVDLDLAKQGFALAGQVRDWRNRGKKTYDLKAPLQPEASA